ncbi:MAG: ATP-binding protein, partial [Oligoflexia bacterium]|nr:ATP-binding protein [Oligoflexia bacterium]
MTIKRTLKITKDSFFLFGPRATGKTTWLREQVSPGLYIDLLKSENFLRFSKHPGELSEIVAANPKWKCIIIDEIQKVPQLLDEVHSIIFEKKNTLQFILSGSSARKLRQSHANFLAGRALLRKFHPFTAFELGTSFNLKKSLEFGMLPHVWTTESMEDKRDYLFAYVETYLREEVQQEALTRNLPAYSAFLEHMALRNSQVINLQNLSPQIGVARTTLKGYLDILVDTLLGVSLPPIQLKAKVKEVATPKFYFFDTGVVRALSHSLDESIDYYKGALLETYILHELMSYSDCHNKRWQFHYWATP